MFCFIFFCEGSNHSFTFATYKTDYGSNEWGKVWAAPMNCLTPENTKICGSCSLCKHQFVRSWAVWLGK